MSANAEHIVTLFDVLDASRGKYVELGRDGIAIAQTRLNAPLLIEGKLLAEELTSRSAVIYFSESDAPPFAGCSYSAKLGAYFKYIPVDPATGRYRLHLQPHAEATSTPVTVYARTWNSQSPTLLSTSEPSAPQPRARETSGFDPHYEYASLDEVLESDLPAGLHSLEIAGEWFDFHYEDRGSEVTAVSFTAAAPSTQTAYPKFSGKGYAEALGVNLLAFYDSPSGSTPAVNTFWHLGTPRIDTNRLIPAVIRHALAAGSGNYPLFVGASAGGYAALRFSTMFLKSATLVMNPRTNLMAAPHRFEPTLKRVLPGWTVNDAAGRFPLDLSELYSTSSAPENLVVYLQNTGDAPFHSNHYYPFREAVRNTASRIHFITDYWGEGHVLPPREVYTAELRRLVDDVGNWDTR